MPPKQFARLALGWAMLTTARRMLRASATLLSDESPVAILLDAYLEPLENLRPADARAI